MKFKRLIPLLAGLALLVTGCYKDDITALQKQIDDLQFFSVKEQVDRIEATVKSLQQADFQKGIDAINASLTQKETALQNQITELQNQISGAAGSTDVEKLEAKLLGLEQQMTEVQNAIKILDDVDLTKTVDDLKALVENASKYEEDIATLKNQFAGLELEKKLAAIEAAYQTAIATSKEEMTKYFDDNFQTKFEELFGKTQSTIETWLTKSKDFQKLIKDFDSVQVVVKNQLEILGLRGSQIDSLKNMADAVEYDIQKAIENAINTLKLDDITPIGNDVETLKTDVNQLRTDVNKLQELPEKIGDFEKLETNLVEAILALQEATMADDQQTLKDLVLALKFNLTNAEGSLVDIKTLISDISANSTQIDKNRDSVGINAAAIKQLQEDLSKLPTTDVTEGLATRIAAIESGVIGEKYNLANIVTDITNITTALSDKNGLIAVENIVAQLNALQDQVGKSTDGADKNTIYGLIAGLDAKLGLIGNKTLKEYVDSTSGANKKALADSLVKVNDKLTALDSRIKAIDGDEVNSLVNRVKALETIVGTGTLNTTAKTLIGAINELIDFLGYQKDKTVEKSISQLIVTLQDDLLAIKGGLDPASTNLLTLSNQIGELKTSLDKYDGIDFDSKKGAEALKSLITTVSGIQSTITDHVTTKFLKDTLGYYLTQKDAQGLYQTIKVFNDIIGEGKETDAKTTVLARISVLEAATVKLADDGKDLTYAEAIKAVFDSLKTHKDSYNATKTEIEKIQGDITSINALLQNNGQSLTGFEATTVIGALNELMDSLGTVAGIFKGYVDKEALDTLASKKMVQDLEFNVTNAQNALINALLGVDKDGKIADFSGNNLKTLKADIDALTQDFWKFKIGGDGDFTIQQAVDSLNNRISSVNSAVNALIGEGFKDDKEKPVSITDYIKSLESTLESITSDNGAIDSVKNNIRGEIAALRTTIIKEVLGLGNAGNDGALDSLNLNALNNKIKALDDIYVTKADLQSAIENLNTGYSKADVDRLVNSIIGALYKEKTGASTQADSLAKISAMVDKFIGALDEIGSASYTGSSITDAIATLQTYVSTLQTTVGDSSSGLVKGLADLTERVKKLEEDVASLKDIVQSIVYVPEYEDGMIYVDGVYNEGHPQTYDNPNRNIELDFRVNTFKDYVFDPTKYTFTGYITSTKLPTKAYATGGDGFEMKFLTFEKKILALQFNSKEITDPAFWSGNAGASIAVEITEKNGNSLTTEYIPLKLNRKTEVPSDPDDPDTPEEPQGVKFVVTPTVAEVGSAGGHVVIEVQSENYWLIYYNGTRIAGSDGILHIPNLDNITIQGGGSQIAQPYFTGTEDVHFYVSSIVGNEPKTYEFKFVEYKFNGAHQSGKYDGVATTAEATFTLTQEPRPSQDLSTKPAACINGIAVGWNKPDTSFVVVPTDQRRDFKFELASDEWVHVTHSGGDAGTDTLTLHFDPRPKTAVGYYSERITKLTLISATNDHRYEIPIVQNPHPAAEFKFYVGETGDTEVDATTAHTFKYSDHRTVNPFKFRVSGDGLRDWTYKSAADKFDVTVGEKDENGVALVTVSPKVYNDDYKNDVTGSISFTLATGETTTTTKTLNFVQSKREESAITVNPDYISFSWDGKDITNMNGLDSIRVDVTAADGFNDWIDPTNVPDWVTYLRRDGYAIIKVKDNNEKDGKGCQLEFNIKSQNPAEKKTLTITQSTRPAGEVPELKITLAGTDDAFDSKEFKWNAANGSDSDKSVTFNVSSSFSGDDWVIDEGEDFGDYFTLTDLSVKGTILNKNYSVTANVVNNDWENDIEKTITFTPKSATGDPVADKAVELTFTIKARSIEDGGSPTITVTPAATDTVVFNYKGKVGDKDAYTFKVAPGTYSKDTWTYVSGEEFDTWFSLDTTEVESGKYTVEATVDDQKKQHVGTLTFTPKAGEQAGTPVKMTFKIEEYTQTLSFKNNNQLISVDDTIKLGYQSTGSYVILVTPNPDENWAAINGAGDDNFTVTKGMDYNASTKTFTIKPKSNNETGEVLKGTVTITSASGKPYVFNIAQAPYVQELTVKMGNTKLVDGSELQPAFAWKKNDQNKIVITVEATNADVNHQHKATVTGNFEINDDASSNTSKQYTITPKYSNQSGEDYTGTVTFSSFDGKDSHTFYLRQSTRGAQTLTATPASGKLTQIVTTTRNYNGGWKYTASFSSLKINISDDSGEKDWSVGDYSYTGGYNVTVRKSNDNNSIEIIPNAYTNKTNDWTAVYSGTLKIQLKDYNDENTGSELSYTLVIRKDATASLTGTNITIGAIGSGYKVTAEFGTPSHLTSLDAKVNSSSIKSPKTSELTSDRTIAVSGSGQNGKSGSVSLTLRVTDPDGDVVKEFKYTFSSKYSDKKYTYSLVVAN